MKAVHVHHTVSLNDYTPEEAPQIVLAICRYHRNSNGWNDIGYNALVDKYGTLYEGRAGGLDQAVVGAQAQGFNSQTAGIANIGDNTSVGASQEALDATATYIRWKLGVHGQPLSGPVTLTSAGGSASRYPAGTQRHARARARPPRHGQDRLPGRRALRPARRHARAGGVGRRRSPTFAARVTAALADQRVDYGEIVPVSGALVGPDGSPLAGQAVEVQVNSDNGWRTARRATTGADGGFATDLKPRQAHVRAGALPGQRGRARRGLRRGCCCACARW